MIIEKEYIETAKAFYEIVVKSGNNWITILGPIITTIMVAGVSIFFNWKTNKENRAFQKKIIAQQQQFQKGMDKELRSFENIKRYKSELGYIVKSYSLPLFSIINKLQFIPLDNNILIYGKLKPTIFRVICKDLKYILIEDNSFDLRKECKKNYLLAIDHYPKLSKDKLFNIGLVEIIFEKNRVTLKQDINKLLIEYEEAIRGKVISKEYLNDYFTRIKNMIRIVHSNMVKE